MSLVRPARTMPLDSLSLIQRRAMKPLLQTIIVTVIVLSSASSYSEDIKKLIVGAWELERYDNINPADEPPAGLVNLTYLFFSDGKSKHFVPGNEDKIVYGRNNNTPYKEFIPFKIEEKKFWGWLGLTNDLYSPRTIRFPTNDEFEINFHDGSIACFKRISDSPNKYPKNKIRSVIYTIRGINYNKTFIQETRDILRIPNLNSKFSSKILGKWLLIDKAENIKMVLEFTENFDFIRTIELLENTLDFEPEIIKGTYRLHGNLLIASTFSGAPSVINIQDGKLTYTMDGIQYITLSKTD